MPRYATARTAFAVPDAEVYERSARTAIKAIVQLEADGVIWEHRRRLIDRALCLLTLYEERHKYVIRYRTRDVLDGAENLRHEHVVPRDWIARGLMAHPEHVDGFLNLAVACVVTVEEDESLRQVDRDRFGWERYLAAGITVCDAADGMRVVDLSELAAEQRALRAAVPPVPPKERRRA